MRGRNRPRSAPVAIASIIAAGAVSVLALRAWVVDPVIVGSDSMEPTVLSGDVVLIDRIAPQISDSLAGRVVTFHNPDTGRVTLKRVAAEAGQTLAIRDGRLYVDGDAVNEPYLDASETDGTFFHRITVPAGHVFLLGDNRAVSIDSRDFGFVPRESITGLALWVE